MIGLGEGYTIKKIWIKWTPAKIKDIYVPGKEINFFLKKNQNWVTAGYLKGNNLQKKGKIQPKLRFFKNPIAITQKVLQLQISDCVHWKAKIINFLKNTIWRF